MMMMTMMMMMMLVSVLSGPLLTMCRLGWPASDAAPLLTTLVPALNPPGSKNHLHHHLVLPDCQSLGLVTLLPVFSSLDGGLVRPRGSAETTRHSFFGESEEAVPVPPWCRPEIDRQQVLGGAGTVGTANVSLKQTKSDVASVHNAVSKTFSKAHVRDFLPSTTRDPF